MKFYIYHPKPGPERRGYVECKSYDEAKAEYQRLQEVYPSREMALTSVNEYGQRTRIHSGRWD